MKIGKFNIRLKDKILIASALNGVVKEEFISIKEMLENTSGRYYQHGLYMDCSGYYRGYDFILNDTVYIGTLSESVAIKDMKKYIKDKK